MIKILCIIPARSGSKGIPHKNIKLFKGIPLFAWSIKQAQSSKYSKQIKIVVSTDNDDYRKIAIQYGAEAPFLRPKEISGDFSTDLECIQHCIKWLQQNQQYQSDIILQLRPTQPCRKVEDIDNCLDLFLQNINKYDSLRTVVEFQKSPYKMYKIKDNQLIPLFQSVNTIQEPYNQCRQVLPTTYLHNGYIDILKTCIVSQNTISGAQILPYLMKPTDTIDIDTIDDWKKAEKYNI